MESLTPPSPKGEDAKHLALFEPIPAPIPMGDGESEGNLVFCEGAKHTIPRPRHARPAVIFLPLHRAAKNHKSVPVSAVLSSRRLFDQAPIPTLTLLPWVCR